MDVQALFDGIAHRLLSEDPGLSAGHMFSSDGLKTGDKFFAMVSKGDLVVKLPEDRVDELVETGAGVPFEIGKRRMREWVRLTPEDTETCTAYVTEARDFVRSLEATSA
jgi:TfoX/Sxy family transcriptional regulator of competence genes